MSKKVTMKRLHKKEAIIQVADLFSQASRSENATTAAKLVKEAVKACTRNKVRIPPEFRRKFCQSCFAFWKAGDVKIRTRNNRMILTCTLCKAVRRFPMRKEQGKRN